MTKEERVEQSRLRSEEHQRRKRTRMLLLLVGTALYVVVPLLWNGAVEFGWVQPIRTPEFQSSLRLVGLVALALIVFNLEIFRPEDPRKKSKQEEKGEQAPDTTSTSA